MNRAFKTLEEIYPHHANEVILTILLAEMRNGPVFVKILESWQHIFEGVKQRKLII